MSRPWMAASLLLLAACDVGDLSKRVTGSVVSTTIEATKGVADGFQDGVAQGRKAARSTDGSVVLSTHDEVADATELAVVEVYPHGSGAEVVLSIENTTDTPVHLIGLQDVGGALLIDGDGFATGLSSSAIDTLGKAIAVPPRAKVRATLQFEGTADDAATVRVWGQDLDVPAI